MSGTTPPAYISGSASGPFTYTSGQYVQVVSGGLAYNMTIDNGADEYLDGGGSATDTIVHQGGEVDVGGYLNSATAYAAGTQLIGGLQSVTDGVAYNTVVYKGGVEDVSSSGTDSGSLISSGGGEHVYSGGIAYDAIVSKGGTEFVTQGGSASSATINAGGRIVLAGDVLYDSNFTATSGTAKAVGVYKGGIETIKFTNLKNSPYNKIVNTATATGYDRYYYKNSVLISEEERIGDEVYRTNYSAGSQTFSTTSPQYLDAGAGSDITVESGGSAVLATTGISDLTVESGGKEVIGGNTVIHSGGGAYTFKFTGITVSDTVIGTGAKEIVKSGNTALSATVTAGGTQVVSNGATAQDSIIDGGTVNLAAKAHLTGGVTFEGSGGELVISATTMPAAVISGFGVGDKIQLWDIPWVAGATAKVETAGVVTVTNSGVSYQLNIAGAAVGQKFSFNSNSVLTTTAPAAAVTAATTPAKMSFLTPASATSTSDALPAAATVSTTAAPAPSGWLREPVTLGAAYALLTSAPPASSVPITLSGGFG